MWVSEITDGFLGGLLRPVGARSRARARDAASELCELGFVLAQRTPSLLADPAASPRQRGVVSPEGFTAAARALTAQACGELTRGESGSRCELAGRSLQVFNELAFERVAPLHVMVGWCQRWRDGADEVMTEAAGRLRLSCETLLEAHVVLQRCVDDALLGICEAFEQERLRAREELTFMATHDVLTGLANRALIAEHAVERLNQTYGCGGVLTLAFIDLDNFKRINDTHGHGAGDELLCSVAGRLRNAVREHDEVGRLGGDEFVVIVAEASAECSPELIAQRLMGAFSEPFVLAEGCVRMGVTASIGLASSSYASVEQLLRAADLAMYEAKAQGRNGYAFARGRSFIDGVVSSQTLAASA